MAVSANSVNRARATETQEGPETPHSTIFRLGPTEGGTEVAAAGRNDWGPQFRRKWPETREPSAFGHLRSSKGRFPRSLGVVEVRI